MCNLFPPSFLSGPRPSLNFLRIPPLPLLSTIVVAIDADRTLSFVFYDKQPFCLMIGPDSLLYCHPEGAKELAGCIISGLVVASDARHSTWYVLYGESA